MRCWKSHAADDGSIHCLGNGKMAVYEQGPNIIQLFGPPYSSPSFIQMAISNDGIESRSERETGTAIWKHAIFENGQIIGRIIDFVDAQLPCMVRHIELTKPLRFKLDIQENIAVIDNGQRFKDFNANSGMMIVAEAGIYIYNKYPSSREVIYQIACRGDIAILSANNHHGVDVYCNAGSSTVYFVGGTDYPECMENAEKALNASENEMLTRTRAWWLDFSGRRYEFGHAISKAIDDVAVLIKTQQAEQGGVLAGHNYHLAYVRDQYGVSRCLLRMGYTEEARNILMFYWGIWKRYGCIHNAQAIGAEGIFHVHENDEVEITGYLIIQAFDLYEASKDDLFLKEILPMLKWAWDVQKKHLANYMLPFNGDETYVAGGILPRSVLNDGSAEATLLFITAGDRLLAWLTENRGWGYDELEDDLNLLQLTKKHYKQNFWEDNRLMANNPQRLKSARVPRFRHGVCEGCSAFGWTERNRSGRYLCPKCLTNKELPPITPVRYYLSSVSLMPLYIGSTLFSKDEISTMLNDIVENYKAIGKLPSRPDGTLTVGYDYGLLLYTLAELKHPMAHEIFERMVSIIDPTGAWAEYYDDDRPVGTRYRPWESGINAEAAIHYAQKFFS